MCVLGEKMRPLSQREEVLGLHGEGYGYKKISGMVGIPLQTVKTWVRRYGHPRGDAAQNEGEGNELAARIAQAVTVVPPKRADGGRKEHTEIIAQDVEVISLGNAEGGRIFLLCGVYAFRGKIDAFLSKVPELFLGRIMKGDVFVFCNRKRQQISALQWQGDGFGIMFKRTEMQRYPWPACTRTTVVEIAREDLQMLLEYPQFIRRISGLQTPSSLF